MTLFFLFAFVRLALLDSFDDAHAVDVETREGTLAMIDDCLVRTGADGVLWRDKSGGGNTRYISNEEPLPYAQEYVIDKRRCLPPWNVYQALRLADPGFDVFDFVFAECARRGAAYGIHETFEENHTTTYTMSFWNLDHPQFWCCAKDGVPWPGHVSLSYSEVMEHRLRFADEHIALKPQRIFLDFWRSGTFHLKYEYVEPNCVQWNQLYPGEKLPEPHDERWIRLCSGPMMRYLREYGRRCRAAGIEFVIGISTSGMAWSCVDRRALKGEERLDHNAIAAWRGYGIDWKQLAREGTIGGIWIMNVGYDDDRPFETTRESLEYVVREAGSAKVYFGVNPYTYHPGGYPTYAKLANISQREAAHRLMGIARETGCAGVVYECVDWQAIPAEVCEELKTWK